MFRGQPFFQQLSKSWQPIFFVTCPFVGSIFPHKWAGSSGGVCSWSEVQGRERGPFRNAVPGGFSRPACKIPKVWAKPQDIVQQRCFRLYSSGREQLLERDFIFTTRFPAGGGGGGGWQAMGKIVFGWGRKHSTSCVYPFTLSALTYSLLYCTFNNCLKTPRAWVKITVNPNITLLLLYFCSQSFPLGRILNSNNGSKAQRQTAHYWKECQEPWEAALSLHWSSAPNSNGFFHSHGRVGSAFLFILVFFQ